jgi:hypothetical protein
VALVLVWIHLDEANQRQPKRAQRLGGRRLNFFGPRPARRGSGRFGGASERPRPIGALLETADDLDDRKSIWPLRRPCELCARTGSASSRSLWRLSRATTVPGRDVAQKSSPQNAASPSASSASRRAGTRTHVTGIDQLEWRAVRDDFRNWALNAA